MNDIIVMGIGNILWQDEGFGVHVLKMLQEKYQFPDNVKLLDGGTMGMELLAFLKGCRKLIIIDAIDGGDAPGSFYSFCDEAVDTYFQEKLAVHELGIKDVIATLNVIGEPLDNIFIVGIQPVSLDMGLDLTSQAQEKCGLVMDAVLNQLAKWQADVCQKVC